MTKRNSLITMVLLSLPMALFAESAKEQLENQVPAGAVDTVRVPEIGHVKVLAGEVATSAQPQCQNRRISQTDWNWLVDKVIEKGQSAGYTRLVGVDISRRQLVKGFFAPHELWVLGIAGKSFAPKEIWFIHQIKGHRYHLEVNMECAVLRFTKQRAPVAYIGDGPKPEELSTSGEEALKFFATEAEFWMNTRGSLDKKG